MAKGEGGNKGKREGATRVGKKAAVTASLYLPEYSKAETKVAKKLADKSPFELVAMTPKEKYYRSGIRCLRCPVVLHKLNRKIKNGEIDYATLLLIAVEARIR